MEHCQDQETRAVLDRIEEKLAHIDRERRALEADRSDDGKRVDDLTEELYEINRKKTEVIPSNCDVSIMNRRAYVYKSITF